LKPRNKRVHEKHYGLFHGPTRIEVEDVTARHKKPCDGCDVLPVGRRLKVVAGAGRSASTAIYCAGCGVAWLGDHRTELGRAVHRLTGADLCVRLRESDED
jgi:hypothetical protein